MMRLLIAFALISLLIVSFIPGCTSPGTDIKVDLAFSEPPVLNKPVKLTETFTLREDYYSSAIQNISAHIKLPDGFEKVDGDLEWNGTLSRGETLNKLEILFNNNPSPVGHIRLGVYADNNGVPGNLLLDAGPVDCSTSWAAIENLNLSVTADTYYWLAFITETSSNYLRVDYNYGTNTPLLWDQRLR